MRKYVTHLLLTGAVECTVMFRLKSQYLLFSNRYLQQSYIHIAFLSPLPPQAPSPDHISVRTKTTAVVGVRGEGGNVLVILRLGLQRKEVGGLHRILLPILQNHPYSSLVHLIFFCINIDNGLSRMLTPVWAPIVCR